MREEDVTITHITVMKWSLNQSTLDGLQILLISNFLLFMVLLRRLSDSEQVIQMLCAMVFIL